MIAPNSIPASPLATRVLVLKSDRLFADILKTEVKACLPGAECLAAASLRQGLELLSREPVDLLVSGVSLGDGDIFQLLRSFQPRGGRFRRLFVVSRRKEAHLVRLLHGHAVDGVFNQCLSNREEFRRAIRQVLEGKPYWSPSLIRILVGDPIGRMLGRNDLRILTVIGDGTDDVEAAELLQMTPASVQSARRRLHRIFGAHHRGELIRAALQYGVVEVSAAGVHRFNFRLPRETDASLTLDAPASPGLGRWETYRAIDQQAG